MSIYSTFFLKNYSFFTYNYIISKLNEHNETIISKYNSINPPLYQGKSDFNDSLISEILNDDYLDNNKVHCISMMIEYMLYWTSKNISIPESNKRYDFLNYFMNNVNQVLPNMIHKPVKSVHGYVIFSDFIKIKNKIVIKTPKTNDEIRNMLFEYYIGSRFLNKLRLKTPNFMYTYGIFMCNPLINVTKTGNQDQISMSVNFCNNNDKNNIYLLFEKIDGLNLHDFILNIQSENELDILINCILQIILSLDIAQKEGQYSHNDLHSENVMLRTLKSPIYHEYIIGKSKYKMKLNYISTIIDYGMNRFVENNIPLGVTIDDRYNLFPFKNTIGNDLYKFLISTVFSLMFMCHKKKDIHKKLYNKVDEVFEFLISFFRQIYKNDLTTSWDDYLLNKKKDTFDNFKKIVFKQQDNYYYPMTDNYIYYNQATPENFIQYAKDQMSNIWNKHINETVIQNNEMIFSYNKIFNPQYDQEEYDDYIFSKCFNSIYMYDHVKQKKTFYELFNKKLSNSFSKECLIDEESMIINYNTIKDCKNILSLFEKNNKELDILDKFEKDNIKYIKTNYDNDVSTLIDYIKKMDRIYSSIDTNIFTQYKNPKFLKVSMEFLNEDMKKKIAKMYEFIKVFEKYLTLTTYSIDLKDIANKYLSNHKFNFDLFEPKMKYFDIALSMTDCINKYNRILYHYYCTRLNEETNKKDIDIFNLSNLVVLLQTLNPHYFDIFSNFLKSFINVNVKSNKISPNYYVPVNSYNQFKNYLYLGQFNIQMQNLISLVSRSVNYDFPTLKSILSITFNKSKNIQISEDILDSFENKYINDLTIYNKLRENKKPKDPAQKEKRNIKRANEVYKYINDALKIVNKSIGGDQYYHLDYGGNDGSVASEFAKITKLDKSQVFSADVESWLGNKKDNLFKNITYNMLSENQKLPYDNESFNSISLLQVLHHIEFIDVHLKEIHRILKPGGILIIKEHDCESASTQMLIDIEHMIHEVVEPEVQNLKILNTYAAFYKSFNDLNKILENIGFEFVSDDYNFNPKYNPTRYYFVTYRKK